VDSTKNHSQNLKIPCNCDVLGRQTHFSFGSHLGFSNEFDLSVRFGWFLALIIMPHSTWFFFFFTFLGNEIERILLLVSANLLVFT
jgi:hypothetical protein